MDEQEILNMETGDKEAEALKPKTVKIVRIYPQEVGDKKNIKLVCEVKHPDREELIRISSVKYEQKGKLTTVGLWVNKDEDSKIRKGSAMAVFLAFLGINIPKDLEAVDVMTAEDEKGYLTFKAY